MTKAERVAAKINTYEGTPVQKGWAFYAEFDAVDPPIPFAAAAYAAAWAANHDATKGVETPLPWES